MNLSEVIQARQSVRAYQSREIDRDTLARILEAINQAPSAGNLQAYRVWLVRDSHRKQQLAQAALGQDFMARAPVVLVFCTEPARAARYGKRGADLYCIQDATVAVAYAQLAATAEGLATCWIGAFNETEVAGVLGLSAAYRPVAMLPVGYAAEMPPRTPRRPLSELVVNRV